MTPTPTTFPQKTYLVDRLAAGEFPLWNNFVAHGYPVIAESQTMTCYPLTLPLYLVFDVNTAYNIVTVLHYILAFLFAWMYARRIGLETWPATLAALVYTYGWFAPRVNYEWSIVTGAWVPLVYWATESYLQTARRRYLLWLSAAISVQLLAGHFNIAFISNVFLVLYICLRMLFRNNIAADVLQAKRKHIAMFVGGVTIGVLIAAVQLLPTWELKQHSPERR